MFVTFCFVLNQTNFKETYQVQASVELNYQIFCLSNETHIASQKSYHTNNWCRNYVDSYLL